MGQIMDVFVCWFILLSSCDDSYDDCGVSDGENRFFSSFVFRLNRIDFCPRWSGILSHWKCLSGKRNEEHFLHIFDCVFVFVFFSWIFPYPFYPAHCFCVVSPTVMSWPSGWRMYVDVAPQAPNLSTMTRQNLCRLKICLRLLFEIFFAFLCNLFLFFPHVPLFHNIRTPFNTISTYTCHTKHTSEHTSSYIYMQYAYFPIYYTSSHSCNSSQTHHAFRYTSTCSVMTENRFILIFCHSFSSSSIPLNTRI